MSSFISATPRIEGNKFISIAIWLLPSISIIFTVACLFHSSYHQHLIPLMKVLFFATGISLLTDYIFRQTRVFGIALFTSLACITAYSVLPSILSSLYWFGICLILFSYREFLKLRINRRDIIYFFSIVILLSILQISYFSLEYQQPYNNAFLNNVNLNKDTLFHTALASMLKSHHVVSQGMHGLGTLEYHFGSHLFIAGSSTLTRLSVWDTYCYIYVFICIPLVNISIICVSEDLWPSKSFFNFFVRNLIYVFLILGSGVLLPNSLLAKYAIWPSFWDSESYAFSLILLMCLLSILLNIEKFTGFLLRFSYIFFITVFITVAKISTGIYSLVILALWTFYSKRESTGKEWFYSILVLIISCLTFFIIRPIISPIESAGAISPFSFISNYIKISLPFWALLPIFLFLHFIFPIASIFLVYFHKVCGYYFPIRNSWLIASIYSTTAIGAFAVLFSNIPGGSAYYFSNPSMFVSLPVLIFSIHKFFEIFLHIIKKYFYRAWLMIITLFIIISLPLIYISFRNISDSIKQGAKSYFENMALNPANASPLNPYIKYLQLIRDDPSTLNYVVFIPRSEINFWGSMSCRHSSYFIPAISERPALYAWPDVNCYSYQCGPRFHSYDYCENSQKFHTDDELLNEAKRLGFYGVIFINYGGMRFLN